MTHNWGRGQILRICVPRDESFLCLWFLRDGPFSPWEVSWSYLALKSGTSRFSRIDKKLLDLVALFKVLF